MTLFLAETMNLIFNDFETLGVILLHTAVLVLFFFYVILFFVREKM